MTDTTATKTSTETAAYPTREARLAMIEERYGLTIDDIKAHKAAFVQAVRDNWRA